MRHAGIGSAHGRASAGAWTSLDRRVGAEHANTRAELRSTKRDHVLANVLSDNLTMLRVGVRENVLDEVVAVLITCNINQWNARAIMATLTNSIEVASKEINTTNLEALLNNLGGKLIHAVLRSIADNMVNCTAAISRRTMLADVLNAPVAELAVSNNVDAGKDFFDARALFYVSLYLKN